LFFVKQSWAIFFFLFSWCFLKDGQRIAHSHWIIVVSCSSVFVCCSVAFPDVNVGCKSSIFIFSFAQLDVFFFFFANMHLMKRLLDVLKPLSMDSVIDGERYFCVMLLFQVRPWCDGLHHNRKIRFWSYNYSRAHFVEARTCHNNKITWIRSSHWLQIRSKNAQYNVNYRVFVDVQLEFVFKIRWSTFFPRNIIYLIDGDYASLTFVGAHLFQERHEWHETFIIFGLAKLFHQTFGLVLGQFLTEIGQQSEEFLA